LRSPLEGVDCVGCVNVLEVCSVVDELSVGRDRVELELVDELTVGSVLVELELDDELKFGSVRVELVVVDSVFENVRVLDEDD